jgi:hypothetical protein
MTGPRGTRISARDAMHIQSTYIDADPSLHFSLGKIDA